MRDPHVEWLSFRVIAPDHVEYQAPPRLEVTTAAFKGVLLDGSFRCAMIAHCQAVDEARELVEPFLRAWEIDAELRLGRCELQFLLEDWAVIDRDPLPGTLPPLQARGTGVVISGHEPSIRVTRSAYPAPPHNFHVSPDVETLWQRYHQNLEGKEPLLSMAYFCLTVLEGWAGSRRAASRQLCLSDDILGRLGELTSLRGDRLSARKLPRSGGPRPLSPNEEEWVRRTIRFLIRRLAEYEAGVELERVEADALEREAAGR